MSKYTITITREFGSLGRPIAHALSQKLGIEYYGAGSSHASARRSWRSGG